MNSEELEKFLGHSVAFSYDGSDLPNGRIGPQEVCGKLINIEMSVCYVETGNGKVLKLQIGEINLQSIKKK
jgi:hypothetical protein